MYGHPVAAVQWIRGELARRLKESGQAPDAIPVTAEHLARLIALVGDGEVSVSAAKQVFARMFVTGGAPDAVMAELGLALESDRDTLGAWVDGVLAAQPGVVAQHRAGRRGALGFLVGQVIKASGGRAHPKLVDQLVRARLDGSEHA